MMFYYCNVIKLSLHSVWLYFSNEGGLVSYRVHTVDRSVAAGNV